MTVVPASPSFRRLVTVGAFAALGLPAAPSGPLAGQSVRVVVDDEVFRQTPDGRRLATVMRDTRLGVEGVEGGWTRVRLEGWVPSNSVAPTGQAGFDLVVSAPGGEELREEPEGRVAARLLRGFLLERVGERGEWTRVGRTGWMWAPSLGPLSSARRDDPQSPAGSGGAAATSGSATTGGAVAERVVVSAESVGLRLSPQGEAVATALAGAELRVLERRRGWARVRLEGWISAAELASAEPDSALAELSAADLRANPEQHVDRRVRWSVQFIALARAEPERTDFYEGEPFMLARAPDPSHGFVYLAVPPELIERVEALEGLETIEVVARVRTGRSALMGVPILELLTLF